MGAIDIYGLLKGRNHEDVKNGIACLRPCDSFIKWRPGLTPKEHIEMIQLEELRKEQRKEAARNRREAKRKRDHEEKMAAAQMTHNWRTLLVAVASVTLTACTFAFNAYVTLKAKAASPPPITITLPQVPARRLAEPPSVYRKLPEPNIAQEPGQDAPARKPSDEPMGD